MDLTLDIYETIRRVVQAIADKENIPFDEAYLLFSKSHTYWCLQTPATLMWRMSFIGSKTKLLKNKLASLVFIKSCKKVVIHKKYGSDYPVYGHLSRFIYILP